MNRSASRELAFKFLYSLEIQKEIEDEYLSLFFKSNEIEDEKAKAYVIDIKDGVNNKLEEITNLISSNLKKEWEIGRISKIDLALLKLSIYEMVYEKLPYKVVINEVVELAKKYSEPTSPSFINGILANVVKGLV